MKGFLPNKAFAADFEGLAGSQADCTGLGLILHARDTSTDRERDWVLGRLDTVDHLLLDAGSALNYDYILDLPLLRRNSIVIYNLSPEGFVGRNNVSYIYGDLRCTILKSDCFDEIVCISTLDHIGMNNTFLYSKNPRFDESSGQMTTKT